MKKQIQIDDELLISYLLGEVSEEQAQTIGEWRASDAANERRFEQFRLIWESSLNFKADANIDALSSLQKLKYRAALQKKQQVKVVPIRYHLNWLKIAAMVLFIAGCSWLYFDSLANKQVQFATQGSVRADTLSDGSIITLNKYALLAYPKKFSGSQRNVSLTKGEAFFKVAHNKAKPFIINTGAAVIKVVGTSFNVNNKNGLVTVIVETGLVQVSNNDNMILLKPGEMTTVQPYQHQLVKENNPDLLYNYYRSKEFVANNVPLYRMVTVLNEAYNSHIVINRKALNNLVLNTTFKTDDSLDNILDVIKKTFKIAIERKRDEIILK